jgi:hypothetical protein
MLQEVLRQTVVMAVGIALLSACAGPADDDSPTRGPKAEVMSSEQELRNNGGLNADGDSCCAVDYREGGKTIMCGKRDGLWCCTEDDSDCANCSWYECEPPPAKLIRVPIVRAATLAR